MKRNIKIFLIITLLLVEVCTIHLAVKSYNSKFIELPQVKLKEPKKQFALMVEQTKGQGDYEDGSATYKDSFPTEGFKLNESMSGCTDIDGKKIEGALSYDKDTYALSVNTNKTAYCYLYYDIYEKPITPLELVASNPQGLTQQPLVGGMHRYQGTDNIPNWIIFGTREECNKDEEDKCTNTNLNNMTYADYVDKYMYRIIGITEEGQLYLLKETFLKEEPVTEFVWNDEYKISGSGLDVCPNGICPEWNDADLFYRINGTANGTRTGKGDNDDGKDNDTDIFVDSAYYDYLKSGDAVNGGGTEEENGEEKASEWYKLIAVHEWYYGDTTDTYVNGNNMYNIETGKESAKHYVGKYGSVTEQAYPWEDQVSAKVSLMYVYDVLYSYPEGINTGKINSWLEFLKDGYNSSSSYEWLSTRFGIQSTSSDSVTARGASGSGNVGSVGLGLNDSYGVRPVFYLVSNIKLTGKGTITNPFRLTNLEG